MNSLALTIDSKLAIKILTSVYYARYMDIKMSKLVRQNKGGTFYLSVKGHELIGAVAGNLLESEKDWAFPYYRDRAFALGLGCTNEELLAAFLARDTEYNSGGRMMPDHFAHPKLKMPCQSSCVGSQFLQAVGVALGIKLRNSDEIVYVSAGDGATSQGDFHEALNFSCIHNLPIVFVIQDNNLAISVPKNEQTAGSSISQMISGYENLSIYNFDGTNYLETLENVAKAFENARVNKCPSVAIAKIPRIAAHSGSDDQSKYRTEDEVTKATLNDPVAAFEKFILEQNVLSINELKTLQMKCQNEIEIAAKAADQVPYPDPKTCDTLVYKDFTIQDSLEELDNDVVMMDALNHALIEEMENDQGVVVFGQDVARGKGGVFGITKNLNNLFDYYRNFNTPLAESTIVGIAIGLSFDGYHKPVAEIQFADYSWTGMNQIINELSSIYYRSKGVNNCPVVIRMPYGGYIQGGPYHSQSIEGYLAHCPGLKIVIPSNASDAKRLLKTAIKDPNPVIFFEHKGLYRQRAFCARKEPTSNSYLPFGIANIVRKGSDITLVAWGMMVMMAVEISDKLKKEDIFVEVIDLRTITPLDIDAIISSLKKTGKLIVVHEAAKNCGFGAEIVAQITESAFHYLDAPVVRVAGKDCPVPYSKILESEVLPQKLDIEVAIRELYSY
jgi:2-oxoisovalerate dehydrogenase E1 component